MSTGEMGLLEYLAWVEKQIAAHEKSLGELRIAQKHAKRAAEEMEGRKFKPPWERGPEEVAKSVGGQDEGKYAELTPRKATLVYLRERGKPATTVEIREALVAGNVKSDAEKFHQTLYNTLRRMANKHKSIVSYGEGLWGLPGWPKPNEEEQRHFLEG